MTMGLMKLERACDLSPSANLPIELPQQLLHGDVHAFGGRNPTQIYIPSLSIMLYWYLVS